MYCYLLAEFAFRAFAEVLKCFDPELCYLFFVEPTSSITVVYTTGVLAALYFEFHVSPYNNKLQGCHQFLEGLGLAPPSLSHHTLWLVIGSHLIAQVREEDDRFTSLLWVGLF